MSTLPRSTPLVLEPLIEALVAVSKTDKHSDTTLKFSLHIKCYIIRIRRNATFRSISKNRSIRKSSYVCESETARYTLNIDNHCYMPRLNSKPFILSKLSNTCICQFNVITKYFTKPNALKTQKR